LRAAPISYTVCSCLLDDDGREHARHRPTWEALDEMAACGARREREIMAELDVLWQPIRDRRGDGEEPRHVRSEQLLSGYGWPPRRRPDRLLLDPRSGTRRPCHHWLDARERARLGRRVSRPPGMARRRCALLPAPRRLNPRARGADFQATAASRIRKRRPVRAHLGSAAVGLDAAGPGGQPWPRSDDRRRHRASHRGPRDGCRPRAGGRARQDRGRGRPRIPAFDLLLTFDEHTHR
jgi:hypothetical protein